MSQQIQEENIYVNVCKTVFSERCWCADTQLSLLLAWLLWWTAVPPSGVCVWCCDVCSRLWLLLDQCDPSSWDSQRYLSTAAWSEQITVPYLEVVSTHSYSQISFCLVPIRSWRAQIALPAERHILWVFTKPNSCAPTWLQPVPHRHLHHQTEAFPGGGRWCSQHVHCSAALGDSAATHTLPSITGK